jgi:Tol biopolymer transport system component
MRSAFFRLFASPLAVVIHGDRPACAEGVDVDLDAGRRASMFLVHALVIPRCRGDNPASRSDRMKKPRSSLLGLALVVALVAGQKAHTPRDDGEPKNPATAAAPELSAPEENVFQQDITWSPDGERIAFSEYAGGDKYEAEKWAIHIVSVKTRRRRPLVENAQFATWSPDGKQLAFGSQRDGNWEIYAIDADGGAPRRLTNHEASDRAPAWSPDGDRIAFYSSRAGSSDIYVMERDGSNARRLTDDPANDYNPSWSPDGKHLVFYRETGDRKDQIYAVAADGVAERRITHDERLNTFPSFLPDGRIAFSSMEPDRTKRLIVIDANGEHRTVVEGLPGGFARWSPDGKQIAVVGGAWPKSAIYLFEADGTFVRKLVN